MSQAGRAAVEVRPNAYPDGMARLPVVPTDTTPGPDTRLRNTVYVRDAATRILCKFS